MNAKRTVIGIMVVIAVLVSSSVVAAENSSADGEVSFDKYYYDQLTLDQKAIYNKLCELKADTVTVSGSAGSYCIEVTIDAVYTVFGSQTLIEDQLKSDALRAWQATKLDANKGMDWAFWTWTLTDVNVTLGVTGIDITDVSTSGVYKVDHYTLQIFVPDQFAATDFFKNAVAGVNTAFDKITVSGDSVSEKVKSINKLLTSDPYKHVDDNTDHTYARTIYAIAEVNAADGSYYLTSEAYAAVYKAICDKSSVPCSVVYGYNDSSTIIAWNVVSIDSKAYAVDVGSNAASSNKEKWLAAGTYSSVDGSAFGKLHQAFPTNADPGLTYSFKSVTINVDGYAWPEEKDLFATLAHYAPWIITGLICVVLAIALAVMAKKGAFN